MRDEVRGVCDILGIDPLYAANEGKIIMVVAENGAEKVLHTLKTHPLGRDANIIGEVTDQFPGNVFLETEVGGKRMVPLLLEDQLPRIC